MAISPDTGSSPGQLNFYQQVALSRHFPATSTADQTLQAQLPVQPFLADALFNPCLLKAFVNQRFSQADAFETSLEQSLLKPSLNQRFSQPIAFETLPRAIFVQTFPQPALFSTSHSRNPCSRKFCSNLHSTSAVSTNRF